MLRKYRIYDNFSLMMALVQILWSTICCLQFAQIEDFKTEQDNSARKARVKNERRYRSIHLNAKKNFPTAEQFEKHFDEVDHFITHFGIHGNGEYDWRSMGYYGGRFEVSLTQTVEIDFDSETIKPIGNPKFRVSEILSVSKRRGGRLGSKHGRQWDFSIDEWKNFQQSRSFTDLGFPKRPFQAVEGIDDLIRKVRQPRITISLLDAKPNKNKLDSRSKQNKKEGSNSGGVSSRHEER